MSAWILTISKEFDDHLQIAMEDGFWDTKKSRNIQAGQDIFFWQAGGSFVGWFKATADAHPIGPNDIENHWHDRTTAGYAYRFSMTLVSRTVLNPSITWTQMQAGTGTRMIASNGAVPIASVQGVTFLRNLFFHNAIDIGFGTAEYHIGDDEKDRVERSIVQRRGQGSFRQSLLDAYRGKCAVTQSPVPYILEAAHIDPYYGQKSNAIQNGLLLRSDIHTLFDLHLLTVDHSFRTRMAPELRPTTYGQFEGAQILVPIDASFRPDLGALERHRAQAAWFSQ